MRSGHQVKFSTQASKSCAYLTCDCCTHSRLEGGGHANGTCGVSPAAFACLVTDAGKPVLGCRDHRSLFARVAPFESRSPGIQSKGLRLEEPVQQARSYEILRVRYIGGVAETRTGLGCEPPVSSAPSTLPYCKSLILTQRWLGWPSTAPTAVAN